MLVGEGRVALVIALVNSTMHLAKPDAGPLRKVQRLTISDICREINDLFAAALRSLFRNLHHGFRMASFGRGAFA